MTITSDQRPTIGVTGPNHGGHVDWWLVAGLVWLAGGRPVRINRWGLSPAVLHGLVLTDGPEIGPTHYGSIMEVGKYDPTRDALERSLLRNAEARNLPVVGIGRGAQLLYLHHASDLHDREERAADRKRGSAAAGHLELVRDRLEQPPGSELGTSVRRTGSRLRVGQGTVSRTIAKLLPARWRALVAAGTVASFLVHRGEARARQWRTRADSSPIGTTARRILGDSWIAHHFHAPFDFHTPFDVGHGECMKVNVQRRR